MNTALTTEQSNRAQELMDQCPYMLNWLYAQQGKVYDGSLFWAAFGGPDGKKLAELYVLARKNLYYLIVNAAKMKPDVAQDLLARSQELIKVSRIVRRDICFVWIGTKLGVEFRSPYEAELFVLLWPSLHCLIASAVLEVTGKETL